MTDNKICVGIDPGSSGFISVLSDGEWFHFEMPKIGKDIDVNALSKIFYGIASILTPEETIHAVVEDVHAIYNSSASSTFAFGYVTGLIEMALVSASIPYTKVAPKTWQKQMWQGVPIQTKPSSTGKTQVNDTKSISLVAAKRLFPNMDFRRNDRCKVADDNKVDSVLIAEFCRRNF